MSQFHDIALSALENAKKLGAQNAKASISRAQNLEISWRQKKLENMSSAGESALSIVLYVDGKFGTFQTSDLRPDSIQAFLQKSIDMTRLLEADPARQLADPELYKNRAELDLDLYDTKVAQFTPAQAIERCRELETLCYEHSHAAPVVDINVGFETSISESYMAISNGFESGKKSTYAAHYADIIYADGDRKPNGSEYSQARYLDDLRPASEVADGAVHFAGMKIGQKKLPSRNRTLIFDRRAASTMVSKFLSPLYGMALVMKKSYFDGKIGQTLTSPNFDLHDEPLIVRGMGSRLYDGEGISSQPRTIFDAGTLKQYLLNVYCANKLGLTPTSGSVANLVLTPGKRSLNEMIADVTDGIYVTSIMGGNMDEVRGDFSHGIVGVAIENGKLTTPVAEMNITGNHLDIWNRLTEVGNDPRTDSSSRIPSLRVEDISVSGS